VKKRKAIIDIDQINELMPELGLKNEKETQTEIHRQQ